jgi:hypothetical protein
MGKWPRTGERKSNRKERIARDILARVQRATSCNDSATQFGIDPRNRCRLVFVIEKRPAIDTIWKFERLDDASGR